MQVAQVSDVASNKRLMASALHRRGSQLDPAVQGNMVKMLQSMRLVTSDHFAEWFDSDCVKSKIGILS